MYYLVWKKHIDQCHVFSGPLYQCLHNRGIWHRTCVNKVIVQVWLNLIYCALFLLQCLWCIKTKSCLTYPVKTILPPQSLCPLNDARWGMCSSKTTSMPLFIIISVTFWSPVLCTILQISNYKIKDLIPRFQFCYGMSVLWSAYSIISFILWHVFAKSHYKLRPEVLPHN